MKIDFADVSVAVVGSVNLDLVARVKAFPEPGETVTNAVVSRFPGGKGGNQAVAAHRLGAQVFMVACTGNDAAANEALETLRNEGVNLDYCQSIEDVSTGLAMILVSDTGENQIVVAPGANAAFHAGLLRLPVADAIIAQLEVPMDTILKAAQNKSGFFCLNAAPAKPVPESVLRHVDLLVVNEIEARAIGSQLAGFKGMLATTFGRNGASLSRKGQELARAMPPKVKVRDTTGAGDAFTAALVVSLVSGLQAQTSLQIACIAGALATTRPGAQSSPTADEFEEY